MAGGRDCPDCRKISAHGCKVAPEVPQQANAERGSTGKAKEAGRVLYATQAPAGTGQAAGVHAVDPVARPRIESIGGRRYHAGFTRPLKPSLLLATPESTPQPSATCHIHQPAKDDRRCRRRRSGCPRCPRVRGFARSCRSGHCGGRRRCLETAGARAAPASSRSLPASADRSSRPATARRNRGGAASSAPSISRFVCCAQ